MIPISAEFTAMVVGDTITRYVTWQPFYSTYKAYKEK
jgi:hypothetical protein